MTIYIPSFSSNSSRKGLAINKNKVGSLYLNDKGYINSLEGGFCEVWDLPSGMYGERINIIKMDAIKS